jgi:hypothetical protein
LVLVQLRIAAPQKLRARTGVSARTIVLFKHKGLAPLS